MYISYDKTILKRVISVLISLIFVINMVGFDSSISFNNLTASADTATLDVDSLWKAKMEELGWLDINDTNYTTPLSAMWHYSSSSTTDVTIGESDDDNTTDDTTTSSSSKSYSGYSVDLKVTFAYYEKNASSTTSIALLDIMKYSEDIFDTTDITTEFLNGISLSEWKDIYIPRINNEFYELTGLSKDNVELTDSDKPSIEKTTVYTYYEPTALVNNEDFLSSIKYEVKYDAIYNGYYREYHVYTADELAVLLYYYQSSSGSIKASTSDYYNGTKLSNDTTYPKITKLSIVLENDLDLGGSNGTAWYGYRNTSYLLEIDGNGHTIYDGYFKSLTKFDDVSNSSTSLSTTTEYGHFLRQDNEIAIHDVTFSNMFIPHNYGMFGNSVQCAYFDNVNWEHCLATYNVKAGTSGGTTIVLGQDNRVCYFRDCTISNSYVYGNQHSALFASYNQGDEQKYSTQGYVVPRIYNSSYYGDTTVGEAIKNGNKFDEEDILGNQVTISENNNNKYYWYFTDINDDADNYYFDGEKIPSDFLYKFEAIINSKQVSTDSNDNAIYLSQTLNLTFTLNGTSKSYDSYYAPNIYQDCATIDSEVYEHGGEHSGTFVSCVRGSIIFKRCFSNCTIYAKSMCGVFLGCMIGCHNGFYYPLDTDEDGTVEKTFVNAYFEDCFTSGLVEGSSEIGGFVGAVFNDNKNSPARQKLSPNRGKVVFYNCYSTSSVGMEYSGIAVGGFAGMVRGNCQYSDSDATHFQIPDDEKAHLFINCYAAGEVGGITTYTSEDSSTTNKNAIGGFFGVYVGNDTSTGSSNNVKDELYDSAYYNYNEDNHPLYYGTTQYSSADAIELVNKNIVKLTNCYYDMQTTAMRERDVGNLLNSYDYNDATTSNSYKYTELNLKLMSLKGYGLTGVYTKTSNQKNVDGLADTTDIMSSSHWQYQNGYYPQIASITTEPNADDYGTSLIDKMKYYRALTYYRYSLASTSTIFLNHYDTYMNTSGNEVDCTDSTVYDTVRDITSVFSFTSAGNSDTPSGVGTAWQINTNKNAQGKFTSILGRKYDDDDTGNSNYTDTYKLSEYDSTSNEEINYTRNLSVLTIVPSTVDEDGNKIENYLYRCTEFAPGKQWVTVYVIDSETYDNWNTEKKAYEDYVTAKAKYDMLIQSYGTYINGNYSSLGLDSGLTSITEESVLEAIAKLTTENYKKLVTEIGTELIKPTEVDDPGDVPSLTDDIIGKRNLRLLPMAYIDAGSDMTIYITAKSQDSTNTESEDKFTNKFMIKDIDGNGTSRTFDSFYHDLTTAYAITSKENLGDSTLYSNQEIGSGKFAETNVFSKVPIDSEDNPYQINTMTDMALIGNSETGGQTIVKVYSTKYDEDTGILNKDTEISGDALEEWQKGNFQGENDKGYYYMEYYWRMNDGRYLSDLKLVEISSDSYTVEMISGVLNATGDELEDGSIITSTNEEQTSPAIIDVKVREEYASSLDDFNFPSSNSGGWYTSDYETYNETITYDNEDYWSKSFKLTTSNDEVYVAWRRNTDYILTTLVVQVWDNNQWNDMVIIIPQSDGTYSVTNYAYSYTFKTKEYKYHNQEKVYEIISNDNAVSTFTVQDLASSTSGVGNYIHFNFATSTNSSTGYKNIQCIAYFRKVEASVVANKYVLIDDGTDTSDDAKQSGVIQADEYREVNNKDLDNESIDFEEQKAVLSGDTLIYRTQIKNDGYYNSQTANFYETLPDGVHLLENSIKIYRQAKDITNSSVKYGDIEYYCNGNGNEGTFTETRYVEDSDDSEITYQVNKTYTITETTESNGTVVGKYKISSMTVDGDTVELNSNDFEKYNKGEYTEGTLYKYRYYTDDDGKINIDWTLNTVSMEYDYYLEYKVIVDDIGVENTYKEFESVTNYDNIFMNGTTINTSELDSGHLNSNYENSAIIKLSESETDASDFITYTIEFNLSSKYKNPENVELGKFSFECKLDDSITISESGVTLNGEKKSGINGSSFSIDISDVTTNNDIIIKITCTTSDTPTLTNPISSKFSVVYYEYTYTKATKYDNNEKYYIYDDTKKSYSEASDVSSDTDFNGTTYYTRTAVRKENSLTKTEKITNTTVSTASWLYLNLRKEISQQDSDQTFIFKVERFENDSDTTPTDVFYVDINCNSSYSTDDTTTYTYYGEQPIKLGKRGYYKVTELSDWSATDYETNPYTIVYSSNLSTTTNSTYTTYSSTLSINNSDNIAFNLPVGLYTSTAIPLPVIFDTTTDNAPTLTTYPTVIFTNETNGYVWKTAQSYAQNKITIADE